jgi:hypothetical protein
MTEIRKEHIEWAVVDRLSQMLKAPPHSKFNVTHTFALFSSILCWTLQHIRIKKEDIKSDGDKAAAAFCEELKNEPAAGETWLIPLESVAAGATVPAPQGFEGHTAFRFLKNLRDAMAHGDARKVEPFHTKSKTDRALLGFLFKCEELDCKDWTGQNRLAGTGHATDRSIIGRALLWRCERGE